MDQLTFGKIQPTLPSSPGIYKYYGAEGQLLYIGKAKNIRKRVSSYFTASKQSYKTHELVRQIQAIDFTIVDTEHDALLLENALIKEFKPRFNIELKDDKTYPYIVIKKEPFPRVFLTRKKIQDGSTYLGPFTSSTRQREILAFIKQHIPLRTCSLNLSATNIQKKKFKVCLEYHLGNCKAPCIGLQSEAEYSTGIEQVKHILQGNLSGIIDAHKRELKKLVAEMAFEKAGLVQQKIDSLKNYQSTSVIVSPRLGDLDVFATASYQDQVVVSCLLVRKGTIVNSGIQAFTSRMEESTEELLPQAILELLSLYKSDAKELVVSTPIGYGFGSHKITIPKGGEKMKLLSLAQNNANYYVEELRKKTMLQLKQKDEDRHPLLTQLKKDLSLNEVPVHIECFDNSNFQGSYPVAAMVCFKNGMPSKKDYRHFHIKTVTGINDFASMKEAVGRRYARLLAENSPLPQLVIIDGGKGQLGAALEALQELGLDGKMTMVGLAKNVEELFFPGDRESLQLGYQSATLQLIRAIRDEVHRFGIGFHRKLRSKGTFKNELEDIKGIGEQTANQLLQIFRSVNNIKKASEEDLVAAVGKKKTTLLLDHFNRPASSP
jgi:excinuclease ABC subunit C